ncbi:MAG: hypothetical protein QME27_04305 [Syntrophaceae bacterium]|nr:hypothetical protein [Syntrophaceae bacterium]
MIIIIIAFTILASSLAWAESCYRAGAFTSVSHDRQSTVTLEASRVKAINGDRITYDLGPETITIQAESFAAQRFLRDVDRGRCSAQASVTLEPVRKSPFNTSFKAIDPRDAHCPRPPCKD